VQWGDKIERLEALVAKGRRVPALEQRPDLPAHLLPTFDCVIDLSIEARWGDVHDWCQHYGQDLDEIWPLIRSVRQEMHQWQQSRSRSSAPASAAPSPRK